MRSQEDAVMCRADEVTHRKDAAKCRADAVTCRKNAITVQAEYSYFQKGSCHGRVDAVMTKVPRDAA